MMSNLFFIAMGGALGATIRYGMYGAALRLWGASFPFGTLLVNLVGCFIAGGLVAYMDQKTSFSPELKLFLMTGILGALTTFSNFILDLQRIIEGGDIVSGTIYLSVSLLGSIVLVMGGMFLTKALIL